MLRRVSRTSYEGSTESYKYASPKTGTLNPEIARYENLNKTTIRTDTNMKDDIEKQEYPSILV